MLKLCLDGILIGVTFGVLAILIWFMGRTQFAIAYESKSIPKWMFLLGGGDPRRTKALPSSGVFKLTYKGISIFSVALGLVFTFTTSYNNRERDVTSAAISLICYLFVILMIVVIPAFYLERYLLHMPSKR